MPLYEYECRSCKARFERLVFDRTAGVFCRECGSAEVAQLLSTFSVGGESAKAAPQESPCAGCQRMQDGICPMSSE